MNTKTLREELINFYGVHDAVGCRQLDAILARHADTNQQTQQASIWRPVSVKPTPA